MYGLEGKVALVTGAGGRNGIGRAIALRLAEEGADIVLNDAWSKPRGGSEWGGLPAVASEIEELGRKVEQVVADVTDSGAVDAMVDQAVSRFGGIDILVNNAAAVAGADRVPVVRLDEDEWDRVMLVNAKGTFLCCRAVARVMIERGRGGKIINLSSSVGRQGVARFAAYSASKFAVIGFTQSLAKELGQYHINVNAICPSTVDSDRQREIAAMIKPEGSTAEEHHAKMMETAAGMTPLGRIGQPADTARTVAFLASAESDFITGASILVNGGQQML